MLCWVAVRELKLRYYNKEQQPSWGFRARIDMLSFECGFKWVPKAAQLLHEV